MTALRDMATEIRARHARDFQPVPPQTVEQWAAANVDYSRVPDYDTPFAGRFDPDLMPFWRQPLADMHDPECREVVVVKCSRAGADEHLAVLDTLYSVAVDPQTTLYVTRDVELAEGFMDRRIKRGLMLCPVTADAFAKANRDAKFFVAFGHMDLRVYWAKAGGVSKQDGYPRIVASEVSCWPGFAPAMIRNRADMYPFHHIAFYSSPDPTRKGNPDHDPILVLWRHTDQRKWVMPDPGAPGRWFAFEFGGQDVAHGIKWDRPTCDTDTLDGQLRHIDQARITARYVTPAGTVVTEDQREDLMRAGRWEPTRLDAPADRRGYKIVRPMIPIAAGDFGHLAAEFLRAKYNLQPDGTRAERLHNPIRVYFAEGWGEAHRDQELHVADQTLAHCEQDYALKELNVQGGKDAQYGVVLSADVQKLHVWWLARVWEMQQDGRVRTALLDFGSVPTMADLAGVADDRDVSLQGIDIGYDLRASEVADYCAEFTPQRDPHDTRVYALRGEDNMQKSVIDVVVRDALEGRTGKRGQSLYVEIRWHTDVFRSWLMEAMDGRNGIDWTVPARRADERQWSEYVRQVSSTRKIDGVWVPPAHKQDHLFDCECEQLALVRHDGLIS